MKVQRLRQVAYNRPMSGKPFIQLDVDLLIRLYVEERQTTRQIAEKLGVGFRTVLRRLSAAGVDARPPGPDRHECLRNRDWLAEQYVTQRKTLHAIAGEIGASPCAVRHWLKHHGIDRRPPHQNLGRIWPESVRKRMSESKKGKYTGEANPNWRGGKVNPNLRLRSAALTVRWSRAVRERDGHKCVECGATGRLHAHHIKSWKDHPELRHELSNGITLCPPCHQRAHGWKFPEWVYHGESRTSAEHPQG